MTHAGLRAPAALLLAVLSAGCAADTSDAEPYVEPVTPIAGLSSGATCPPMSTLTYDNFGKTFFATYCLKCHSVTISGPMRQAPPGRDFDDLPHVRMFAQQIDQQASAGPTAVHSVMPPEEPRPTLAERMQLGEWLSCGAR